MKILYLDAFSGVSGDMWVGALCDLGVPLDMLRGELDKIEGGTAVGIRLERKNQLGIDAAKFAVFTLDEKCGDHGHHHYHTGDHEHHSHHHDDAEHHHRHEEHCHEHTSFQEIKRRIDASALSPFVRRRVESVFRRIADAEGKIHGCPPESVHFHEVGAWDSIADIVCGCVAIEWLGVDAVWASRPSEGSGFVECSHGRFPVPCPATLEILKGIPFNQTTEPHEMITPTGAALMAEFVVRYVGWDGLTVEKVGYGAGSRSLASRPNVLRAALATVGGETEHRETVFVLETQLDDISPEIFADATERLMKAGALDVFSTPVQMKKNRPGFLLTVLVTPDKAEDLAVMMLTHTTAFGVRCSRVERWTLQRQVRAVATPFGEVQVKFGFWRGREVQASPEFESCKEAADRAGVGIKKVFESVWAALGSNVTSHVPKSG